MKVLVLDNYETFSLVPYMRAKCPEHKFIKMGNIHTDHLFNVAVRLDPDVVFCDFCDANVYYLTKRISEFRGRPRVVVRLHGYELQKWFWDRVTWSEVNDLIVVSEKFRQIVSSKLDAMHGLRPRLHLVYNGIDLSRFTLEDSDDMAERAVAFASHLNKKKGPALLRTLAACTPHLHYHIGGAFQDEQVELYFRDRSPSNMTFYGPVDTNEFLRGKRYILSTSVTESFGMSIAEGMAKGLTPRVHWWPGAELLWPEWCLWATIDEFSRIGPRDPSWCREWVEARYSMDECVGKVVHLLENPET